LNVYTTQTAPLLEYYRQRGLLTPVPGEGSIDGIRASLREAVGR
jgi:adenylate kinase family enzyme